MHRRSPAVQFGSRGIGANQTILIARLELVSITGQRLQVRHPVVTGAGGKDIVKNKGAERCVSPRTSTADSHALSVDVAPFLQIPCGVDTVLDIHDSPLPVQPLTIRPPVSCTS